MAKRRCISVEVMESDKYAEVSYEAKALYIELILRSDDDGVINNVRLAMMWTNTTQKALSELIEKGFVLDMDSVYIITHWNVHNRISPSKKTDSLFQSQLKKLCLTEENTYRIIER